MIRYKTQVGAKHLNKEARKLRDVIKPMLRGMHCRKCNQDTEINFVDDGYGHLIQEIHACCPEFKQRINSKIHAGKF